MLDMQSLTKYLVKESEEIRKRTEIKPVSVKLVSTKQDLFKFPENTPLDAGDIPNGSTFILSWDGHTFDNVQWFHDEIEFTPSEDEKNHIVRDAAQVDSGEYKVVISNANGTAETTINITVAADTGEIEKVFEFMLENDLPLQGAPDEPSWAHHAAITMGVGRGDANPYWVNYNDVSLMDAKTWYALNPWFVCYEQEGNTIYSDIDLNVGNMTAYLLIGDTKEDAIWKPCAPFQYQRPAWASYFDKHILTDYGNIDDTGTGDFSRYAISSDPTKVIHGFMHTYEVAEPTDQIHGIFVMCDVWLSGENAALGKYAYSLGADYYPDEHKSVADGDFDVDGGTNNGYVTGAGGSAFKTLTTEPQRFYFANTTLNPDENPLEVIEKWNKFVDDGGENWITPEYFRANHPPVF